MAGLSFFNIISNECRLGESSNPVEAPRSGETLWDVPFASLEDVDSAAAAAGLAFPTWSQTTVQQRQSMLLGLATLLDNNKSVLSSIIGKETGKSVSPPPPILIYGCWSLLSLICIIAPNE